MPDYFRPVAEPPRDLVLPVAVDVHGVRGPTPGRARGPHFRRTSPGLYVPSGTPTTAPQRVLEQSRRLPPGGAVGGWASLLMHGAAYFDGRSADGRDRPVPLVLPPSYRLHPTDASHAVRPRQAPRVVLRHGIACLDPVDALLWECEQLDGDTAGLLVTIDMALAGGAVDLAALRRLPRERLPRRHRLVVEATVARADGRSLSPRESWLRFVWTEVARLPRPRCNWTVIGPTGQVVAVPDLLDPDRGVAGDYDGSAHRDAARHRRDEERREAMATLEIEHVVVVGRGPGDEDAVARRLRAAYERADARSAPQRWTARPGRLPSW